MWLIPTLHANLKPHLLSMSAKALRVVLYFDQRTGTLYDVCWSNQPFQTQPETTSLWGAAQIDQHFGANFKKTIDQRFGANFKKCVFLQNFAANFLLF